MNFIKRFLLKRRINKGDNDLGKFLETFECVKWMLKDEYPSTMNSNVTIDDIFTLDKINKNVTFNSIVIEGNDITGKETYSNYLYEKINEEFKNNSNRKNYVHQLSFPRYDEYIGELISKILRNKDKSNFTRNILNWLFIIDRKCAINELITLYNKKNRYRNNIILIFDRFFLSNLVYNQNESDIDIVNFIYRMESSMYEKLNMKFYFMFLRNTDDPIHDKLIEEKNDKDLNETKEFQIKIAHTYCTPYICNKILNINEHIHIRYFYVKDIMYKNLEDAVNNINSPYYKRCVNRVINKLFNSK